MSPDSLAGSMQTAENVDTISSLAELAAFADYSYVDTLTADPHSNAGGIDHSPRQVFSGHYVPVAPTPIKDPVYVTHSKDFFE